VSELKVPEDHPNPYEQSFNWRSGYFNYDPFKLGGEEFGRGKAERERMEALGFEVMTWT
jgi:hypothetical protein